MEKGVFKKLFARGRVEAKERNRAEQAETLKRAQERARIKQEQERIEQERFLEQNRILEQQRILERSGMNDITSKWVELNKDRLVKHYAIKKGYLREQRNAYMRQRREADPCFRIMHNLRTRIAKAVKGEVASPNTLDLLGCSVEKLRGYLEAQFHDGMTWDNYGHEGWHVDHIIPCSAFNLTVPEQRKACFHYTNLQPLWAGDNHSKTGKVLKRAEAVRLKRRG